MHLLKVALILLFVCVVVEIDSAAPKPKTTTTKKPTTTKPEFTREGTKDNHAPKPKVPKLPNGCPGDNGDEPEGYQHRIANGRFYIIHHRNRYLYTPTWDNAFKLCINVGMKLAKVNHLTTFWHIMNYWRKHKVGIYKDTWYWISARFDSKDQVYKWYKDAKYHTKKVVEYANYFYRNPRPTGLGAHTDFKHTYWPNETFDSPTLYHNASLKQCLTLAFPWPINDTTEAKFGTYGFNPTMDERGCANTVLRHAICEADEKCNAPDPGPYALSEGNKKYFDEGNFIVGNRLYIVNWQQRDFKASVKHCDDLGLEVYNPLIDDRCLIPYLKLIARNVSTSQWWTRWKYRPGNWTFTDVMNNWIYNYSSNTWPSPDEKQPPGYLNWNESIEIGRSSVYSSEVCVALSHHYEFKSQMHCPDPTKLECQWHYLTYAPANCNNYQGVICQHKDNVKNDKRRCWWKSEWINKAGGLTEALKDEALVPLGFETNVQYKRSKYKQTFGSLYCPPGYSMVRQKNDVWWNHIPEVLGWNNDKVYKYDYMETYWVVDEKKFDKPKGSSCTVAIPVSTGYDRNIKYRYEKVPCTEWHFYLCKKRFKPPIPPKTDKWPNFKEPQYNWNSDWETPRKYSY